MRYTSLGLLCFPEVDLRTFWSFLHVYKWRINFSKLKSHCPSVIFFCFLTLLLHITRNIKKHCELCKAKRRGMEVLTMGVVFLADSIHSPVRPYSQEEAPVFTIQPFGILETPRREATTAAVFRCRGKCCDFSRGHLLLFSRFLVTASSPSSAVQKPHRGLLPPTNRCLFPPPLLHRASHKLNLLNPGGQVAWTTPSQGSKCPLSPVNLKQKAS